MFMFIQPLMWSLFSIMKIVKNRMVLTMNGQTATLYMPKKWISSGKVLTFCCMLLSSIHSHFLVSIVFASLGCSGTPICRRSNFIMWRLFGNSSWAIAVTKVHLHVSGVCVCLLVVWAYSSLPMARY